jgi:hypothetical protein
MEVLCLRLPRKAAQAKVAGFGRTRMIFRDDVIDLEG